MATVEKVEQVINDFLKKYANEEYDEDELFDLQWDVAEVIVKEEFPGLTFDQQDPVEEVLWGAAEHYLGEITDRIRRKQKPERTTKMAKALVKRGKAFFSRITKKP